MGYRLNGRGGTESDVVDAFGGIAEIEELFDEAAGIAAGSACKG